MFQYVLDWQAIALVLTESVNSLLYLGKDLLFILLFQLRILANTLKSRLNHVVSVLAHQYVIEIYLILFYLTIFKPFIHWSIWSVYKMNQDVTKARLKAVILIVSNHHKAILQ